MPKEFSRSDRVADAVQRILAQIIPSEIRDPRLGMVNINAVEVARDLSLAKVYITLVGENDAQQCRQSAEILNRASSFLRNLVGKELTMRSTPRLQFIYDESAVRGQHLSSLIDSAIASDNANRSADEE